MSCQTRVERCGLIASCALGIFTYFKFLTVTLDGDTLLNWLWKASMSGSVWISHQFTWEHRALRNSIKLFPLHSTNLTAALLHSCQMKPLVLFFSLVGGIVSNTLLGWYSCSGINTVSQLFNKIIVDSTVSSSNGVHYIWIFMCYW